MNFYKCNKDMRVKKIFLVINLQYTNKKIVIVLKSSPRRCYKPFMNFLRI